MGAKKKKRKAGAKATGSEVANAEIPVEAENPEDDTEVAGGGGSWPVDRLQPVVEALLFAAADPVTPRKLAGCVAGATADEVRAVIRVIQEECKGRGVRLVEVAGGWQLRTAAEYHEYVRHLFKQKQFRLTRAGIETVAIVAYKQPATRAEIEEVRGVDSTGVLESLVERGVVRIAGRRDVPGRPLVYVTTPLFLEMFGLKDLKGLPTLAELGDDVRGFADTAGFEEGSDREAAILPLEDSASGDEDYPQNDEEEIIPKVGFARRGAQRNERESEGGQAEVESAADGAREEDDESRDGRQA